MVSCDERRDSIILYLFLCEGFFPALKFNLWKGFLSQLFWVASINEVSFKLLNVLFKIGSIRACTKKSQSFSFYKAPLNTRWVTRGKFCILKCLSWLEMCFHIKNWFSILGSTSHLHFLSTSRLNSSELFWSSFFGILNRPTGKKRYIL